MLEWLQNTPRAGAGSYAQSGPDADPAPTFEPPETPAPVFAIRALKSAIFGTPKEEPETRLLAATQAREGNAREGQRAGTQAHRATAVSQPPEETEALENAAATPATDAFLSPTKPNGILLTPGTGANRRKTVSFGEAVVDNEGKATRRAGQSGVPANCPGKFPSPWTPKSTNPGSTSQRTTLTESLYKARNSKSSLGGSSSLGQREAGNQHVKNTGTQAADTNEDDTIDVKDPKSSSGIFWKAQYEDYQSNANDKMRKIIKYKELAKSYAKKKDAEALDLGKKLREERQKVTIMEQELSKFAGQIVTQQLGENEDGSQDPEAMKELARQTTLALQYKSQVDQFEDALTAARIVPTQDDKKKDTSAPAEQALLETKSQLDDAKKQIARLNRMSVESETLKKDLQSAQRRASTLEREKSRLVSDLTRLKERLDQRERNWTSREENYKAKIAQLEAEKRQSRQRPIESGLRRDLQPDPATKESDLRTQRPSQSAIPNFMDTPGRCSEEPTNMANSRQTTNAHVEHTVPSKLEIPGRTITPSRDDNIRPALVDLSSVRRNDQEFTGQVLHVGSDLTLEPFKNSDIREWSTLGKTTRPQRSTRKTSKSPKASKATIGKTVGRNAGFSGDSILADVNINASYEKLPSRPRNNMATPQRRPINEYVSESTQQDLESLTFDLPSPEPYSENSIQLKQPNRTPVSSKVPGPASQRTDSSLGKRTRRDISTINAQKPQDTASSRIERSLPPERAQAARARLKEKMALRKLESASRLV
ncbi:MAG: hypothetical protein M4579_001811 [Chaenotheca gracillima]|nr:MAG: hypothetical protein M4579_001811 [Chaenotheca gracillima]